jgi:hypothetical protein
MGIKVRRTVNAAGEENFLFWCPGCDVMHAFRTHRDTADTRSPVWTFNNNAEKPTFSPSLLIKNSDPKYPGKTCHLYLRDGVIEYLQDSQHKLAGEVVACPEFPR